MKKRLLYLVILLPVFLQAQKSADHSYLEEIGLKVESEATEKIHWSDTSSADYMGSFYNDHLVYLVVTTNGELANSEQKEYFLRNDTLIAVRTKKCLTSLEILDLDLYSESHRDAAGNVDYSALPTDCMTVTLFCESSRMTREIDGKDVFDDLPEFTVMKRAHASDCQGLISRADELFE